MSSDAPSLLEQTTALLSQAPCTGNCWLFTNQCSWTLRSQRAEFCLLWAFTLVLNQHTGSCFKISVVMSAPSAQSSGYPWLQAWVSQEQDSHFSDQDLSSGLMQTSKQRSAQDLFNCDDKLPLCVPCWKLTPVSFLSSRVLDLSVALRSRLAEQHCWWLPCSLNNPNTVQEMHIFLLLRWSEYGAAGRYQTWWACTDQSERDCVSGHRVRVGCVNHCVASPERRADSCFPWGPDMCAWQSPGFLQSLWPREAFWSFLSTGNHGQINEEMVWWVLQLSPIFPFRA